MLPERRQPCRKIDTRTRNPDIFRLFSGTKDGNLTLPSSQERDKTYDITESCESNLRNCDIFRGDGQAGDLSATSAD